MARLLLINPSYHGCYANLKASIVDPVFPTLGLATIAAGALERGHRVEILDLSWRPYDFEAVRRRIRGFRPDVVGVTATTPLMNQARDISVLARDVSADIRLVVGGPHPSALPRETLLESRFDAVVVGEGDHTLAELCDGGPLADVPGVVYRDGEALHATAARAPIEDLDTLPMPAWHLYDHALYRERTSRLYARRVPFVTAEFSRGCVFECDYCASKNTMARGYRKKSPARCAAEVERMRDLGIREFMLADDIFTSDQRWATEVCEAIAATGADVLFTCTNGIRVESAEPRLFEALRRAGCYRVSFGFESGSDEVLRRFGKGGRATIEQGRRAVELARRAGIETNGYFMLGLSSDTAATMRDTIEYARSLPLDMLKFSKTVAFPGTPMFHDYARRGLIRSYDWDDYYVYSSQELFNHPELDDADVNATMTRAYRRAILTNPAFIARRLRRALRTGELLWDAYYFAKFVLMRDTAETFQPRYYARDRWPVVDLRAAPPEERPVPTVRLRRRRATAS